MLDVHNRLYASEAPYILGIPAYTFFVGLGMIAGLIYYFTGLRRRGQPGEGAALIVFAGLLGGVLGSKVPLLLEGREWYEVLYGKSIVGGLIGGMLGVIALKKALGIRLKLGNVIAPAIALGMAIGRLGCFFNGCCCGVPARWGFDFGDGIIRLPAQLMESAFHISAFAVLVCYKDRVQTAGILFKLYLSAYFVFRFLTEFVRENPPVCFGLTVYQLICASGLLYMTVIMRRERKHGRGRQEI